MDADEHREERMREDSRTMYSRHWISSSVFICGPPPPPFLRHETLRRLAAYFSAAHTTVASNVFHVLHRARLMYTQLIDGTPAIRASRERVDRLFLCIDFGMSSAGGCRRFCWAVDCVIGPAVEGGGPAETCGRGGRVRSGHPTGLAEVLLVLSWTGETAQRVSARPARRSTPRW
jgi:hypothetical protein